MAIFNLAPCYGQSLLGSNTGAALSRVPDRTSVFAMNAGFRALSTFSDDGNWNTWGVGAVTTDTPVKRIADEWEAREVGGHQNIGNLILASVVRNGGSFSVTNPTDNSSQFNLSRHVNASGAWTGGFYAAPTESEGVWATGTGYSCIDTIIQQLEAIRAFAVAGSHTLILRPVLFGLGQGDALTAAGGAGFYAGMTGLRTVIADALQIDDVPWVNMRLAGAALDRDGAAGVNAAMAQFEAAFALTGNIDPATFPEYDPESPGFGGLYNTSDNIHLSSRGCWRVGGDAYWKAAIDNGMQGVTVV